MRPFLVSGLASKRDGMNGITGHRGNVCMARSEEEAVGVFMKNFANNGYVIDLVEAVPLTDDLCREIGKYIWAKDAESQEPASAS